MSGVAEKGGGSLQGIKLLLCENPLPPIEEAIAAARASILGPGTLRVTPATPPDNGRFVDAPREIIARGAAAA
jgi:histidinol-phosphate/aromatic aminotransferase/cobyric acid decarboxylase-like protein